ncbi:hypothetical protein AB1Y20_021252 [Prymnesium parvum]|uniref:Uncharacterized protein n=1 Tax=Prymnesium parvum TaxID=97485 RepID=A0AB34JKS9_PRYPA
MGLLGGRLPLPLLNLSAGGEGAPSQLDALLHGDSATALTHPPIDAVARALLVHFSRRLGAWQRDRSSRNASTGSRGCADAGKNWWWPTAPPMYAHPQFVLACARQAAAVEDAAAAQHLKYFLHLVHREVVPVLEEALEVRLRAPRGMLRGAVRPGLFVAHYYGERTPVALFQSAGAFHVDNTAFALTCENDEGLHVLTQAGIRLLSSLCPACPCKLHVGGQTQFLTEGSLPAAIHTGSRLHQVRARTSATLFLDLVPVAGAERFFGRSPVLRSQNTLRSWGATVRREQELSALNYVHSLRQLKVDGLLERYQQLVAMWNGDQLSK